MLWVFSRGTTEQCRIFCCGLWTIWTNRNKLVYENRQTTARDISYKISDFFAELKGIEEKKLILADVGAPRTEKSSTRTSIYFDAAFDSKMQDLLRVYLSEVREGRFWSQSQSFTPILQLVGAIPNTVRLVVERMNPRF